MRRTFLLVAAAAVLAAVPVFSQPARQSAERAGGNLALAGMVRAEQAFAARALVVGWKQSFLEYFADAAIGFEDDQAAPAKSLFRKQPDPPKELRILWEPRYGDIAASGDLGYLTGPVRTITPARNNGQPRHSIYASVWKRQPDGMFKVVMDIGVTTPGPVPFPDGFTAAPRGDAYVSNASTMATIRSLRDTDAALTNAARAGQADAYRGLLGDNARLHRADVMPIVGQDAIVAWLTTQPPYAAGESKFAEAALSGDLGYTYGTYALEPGSARPQADRPAAPEHGFYVRVWTRGLDGVWRVALDVLQPQ
jgi:ketosteroid isomerase-like protein